MKLQQQIPNFMDRLGLKPGLTGIAQVVNGYDNELEGGIDCRQEFCHCKAATCLSASGFAPMVHWLVDYLRHTVKLNQVSQQPFNHLDRLDVRRETFHCNQLLRSNFDEGRFHFVNGSS